MRIQHDRRWLWVEWMLATWIGYTLAILAVLPWVVQLAYTAQPVLLAGLIAGAVLGGIVGAAQWLVLRRHVQGVDGWWLAASIAGGICGLALGMFLADMLVLPVATGETRPAATPVIPVAVALQTGLIGVVVGVVYGAAQWLVLRRILPMSGWWIVASGLGWMAGMGIGAALAEITGVAGALLITSTISGLSTGLVLQYWVQHQGQSVPDTA